jgi:TonB family protein
MKPLAAAAGALLVLALAGAPAAPDAPADSTSGTPAGTPSTPAGPSPPGRPGDAADTTADAAPAATPADTTLRVPGTWLRFGFTPERVLARTSFAAGPGSATARQVIRQGKLSWFGVPGEATLTFRDGRLTRVAIAVAEATPRDVDYVQDELRRLGFRRDCERLERAASRCDWTGRTLVRLTTAARRISADIEPLPPSMAAGAARPSPASATRRVRPAARASRPAIAGPDTVPVRPDTLLAAVRGLPPALTAGRTTVAVLDTCPLEYPATSREAGIQGRVWVRALVDTTGRALEVRIRRSIPMLDDGALAAVRCWRFAPWVQDGVRWRYWLDVPITFTFY